MSTLRRTALIVPLAAGLIVGVPAVAASHASAATAGLTYRFGSPPIASAGSIPPGQSVTFDLSVQSGGRPAPGGVAFIGYTQGHGAPGQTTTVTCAGTARVLPSNGLISCAADSKGVIPFTYTVPAQPPAQDHVAWIAQASAGPPAKAAAIDHYVYSTVYRFAPSPITGSGTVSLSADDALGRGIPNDTVYLSFAGSGSASVGGKVLTASPTLFSTDGRGVLPITFTAGAGPGSITVQDLRTAPMETVSDSYAPGQPVISVGDVTVTEGDQHPGIPANSTVTISPVQPKPVTVSYVTLCGIGDKGCNEDYNEVTTPTSVTIPANTSSVKIDVEQFSYVGANAGETYNEGWFVELLNPSTGVLGRAIGAGMLLPDVEGSSTPRALLYTGSAGARPSPAATVPLYFTVTLGAVEATAVTFHYATTNGSAAAGTDYTAASGTATIAPGSTSVVIPVTLLPNAPPPSDRSFTLTISGSSGPPISLASGTGTIIAG